MERRDAATAGLQAGAEQAHTSTEGVARRRPDPLLTTIIDHLTERAKDTGGPDRSLDWEIHLRHGLNGVGTYGNHPAYTGSVDAALTLVPKHHLWELRQGIESRAIVWTIERDYDDDGAPTGYAATFPAIALCIAALRAEDETRR